MKPVRIGLYAFLAAAALVFAAPLYVMLATSLKSMDEIQAGSLLALPQHPTLDAWRQAWNGDCGGADCGVASGWRNSFAIAIPATVLPVLLGALTGYALSFWRPRFSGFLFAILMVGAFVPLQVMVYPLVRVLAAAGWFGSLPGIVLVHTVFGMPMLTLLFRNYFLAVPRELFHAARVDGGGFLRIFVQVMLPLAVPMLAVAAILQFTGVWNDYLLGLVFAGPDHQPMTVQLNNLVNTTTGQRLHHVNMAATFITAAVPLVLYFCAGRWFVRGITAGAVKG